MDKGVKRLCTHRDLEWTNNNVTDLNKELLSKQHKNHIWFSEYYKTKFQPWDKMSEGEELEYKMKAEDTEEGGRTIAVWPL